MLLIDNLHAVELGFGLDVQIVRHVRNNTVLIISKDAKSVFVGLLLKIRYQFGINAALKYHFAVSSPYNLSAVIRHNISVVGVKLEHFGKSEQSVCRTP